MLSLNEILIFRFLRTGGGLSLLALLYENFSSNKTENAFSPTLPQMLFDIERNFSANVLSKPQLFTPVGYFEGFLYPCFTIWADYKPRAGENIKNASVLRI